jgi:hypothetical protein
MTSSEYKCKKCNGPTLNCWCLDPNDDYISPEPISERHIRYIIKKKKEICQHTNINANNVDSDSKSITK